MHPHRLTNPVQVKSFILAGNATFTLVSKKTGTRFTYKARQPKKDAPHFISLMNGPDNYSDFVFIGSIFSNGEYRHGRRTRVGIDTPSVRAFIWFWGVIGSGILPDSVEFWHEGTCGRCGRKLTVPSSIESGIGPECIKKVR